MKTLLGVGDKVKVINGNLDGEKGVVTIVFGKDDCQIQIRDNTYRMWNKDLRRTRKYRGLNHTPSPKYYTVGVVKKDIAHACAKALAVTLKCKSRVTKEHGRLVVRANVQAMDLQRCRDFIAGFRAANQ